MMFLGVSDIFEDAFEPPEVIKTVNLYLFIGVEAGTAVLAIIIICCLIYYIVQLKDKESQYENLEN
jgi:ABC-type multidrug transport system permease subunit